METGLSEPSPLAKRSRVHFGSDKVHIFEEFSSELGATQYDDINVKNPTPDSITIEIDSQFYLYNRLKLFYANGGGDAGGLFAAESVGEAIC